MDGVNTLTEDSSLSPLAGEAKQRLLRMQRLQTGLIPLRHQQFDVCATVNVEVVPGILDREESLDYANLKFP